MNERDDLDRLLTAWFAVDAPLREPEPLLGQVLTRTVRTRRRPAWRIPERWIPVSTIYTHFAATSRFPWRTVGAIALLILALVGAMVIAGSRTKPLPAPFGPAHNGKIAFSEGGDIVAIESLTGKRSVLIGGPTQDSIPWFSPDGSRVAFVRGDPSGTAELWAADADGRNPIRLAEVTSIGWVEWSPQSDVIAVTNDMDPSSITMVRADGSGSTVIHTFLDVVANPFWRPPDGSQLAFRGKLTTGAWGIYLIERDGSGTQHLDLDPGFEEDPYYAENSQYYFGSLAWSPDGSKLMYHTLEPDSSSPAGPGFRIHIAAIAASGFVDGERQLEFDVGADDEFNAMWLPAGDEIVFDTLEGTEHRLTLADPNTTTSARDLGVLGVDGLWFQVSPDGRQILSSTSASKTSETTIQVTELSSGVTSPLTINDDYAWQRTAE